MRSLVPKKKLKAKEDHVKCRLRSAKNCSNKKMKMMIKMKRGRKRKRKRRKKKKRKRDKFMEPKIQW